MYRHKGIVAGRPLPEPLGGVHPVILAFEYITKASEPLTANSVIEIGGIPANCVVEHVVVVFEDIDSNGTPTAVVDIGILSGLYGKNDDTRTVGTQLTAANQTPRTGGIVSNSALMMMLEPSSAERGIGIKFTNAPATQVNGAKIRCFVTAVQTGPSIT